MKKRIIALCMVMLFGLVLSPAIKLQAANVSRTFDNTDTIEYSNVQEINKYGDAAAYAGGKVLNASQTGITATSATISWDPASGAAGYHIVEVVEYGGMLYVNGIIQSVQSTSITLNLPQETYGYLVGICPYDAAGNYNPRYTYVMDIYTTPKQITGLKLNGSFGDKVGLSVIWDYSKCYGFEAVCYNKKGKQVQSVDTTMYPSAKFTKANTQNIYTVKVRPYVIINGSQRVYGDWSKVLYAVPQPKIASKNSDIKRNSINLKWKKVNGATKYEIYVSTKQKSGYKKVATVKGSQKSYTVRTYKGKTIDLVKNYHYVKIVTYAKFGKKTVKSKSDPQMRATVHLVYQ